MQLCYLDVILGGGHSGPEPVKAQPGRHRRQPTGKVGDLLIGAVEPEPGLLDDVLGLRLVPQHPSGEADKAGPFALKRDG